MSIRDWFFRPVITVKIPSTPEVKEENKVALSYEEYVRKYLNKMNPANEMYWVLNDVVIDSGASPFLIEEYLKYSQKENTEAVQSGHAPLTDDEYIAHWNEDHPATTPPPAGKKPFADCTVSELEAMYNRS